MEPSAEKPRAARYDIQAPLRYRRAGDVEWREGRTVNVSFTGVLFETVPPVIPTSAGVEFVLSLPTGASASAGIVRCRGTVVRHCAPSVGGEACGVAATIDEYEFLRCL